MFTDTLGIALTGVQTVCTECNHTAALVVPHHFHLPMPSAQPLTPMMRHKCGFQGYVTSDSGVIADIFNQHMNFGNASKLLCNVRKAYPLFECVQTPYRQVWLVHPKKKSAFLR
jgi:hypothetical protein